jgi:hypothetical protein
MCNALLIEPGGYVGWWTNEFATVEEGEPAPEDTDCYAPLKWCVDSWGETLDNTLWYYFYGPETGIATIKTRGFDTQIALYRADSCEAIAIENLVAANDDPDEQNPAEVEAVLENIPVDPGEKYYLQLDGSLGGETGTFDIIFYPWLTGVEDQKITQSTPALSIFPNPGKGIFNIRVENVRSSGIDVILYNLNGRILKQKSFQGISGDLDTRFDLSDQPGGIYHIRVLDGERIIDGKLVKQ